MTTINDNTRVSLQDNNHKSYTVLSSNLLDAFSKNLKTDSSKHKIIPLINLF